MADQLRLRVVLDLAERVLAPMKRISGASGETARALKAARDRLKELNDQQAAVGNVQKHAAELARLNNALKVKQALLDGMRTSGTATAAQLKREESGVRKIAEALELQKSAAVKARAALNAMGVTGNLAAAQARLKTDIDGATAAMSKQRAELARLSAQQRKIQELRDKHAKAVMHAGVAAGASAAMVAGGNKIASPLRSVVDAFIPAENAETQLGASMMTKTGAVAPEFKQVLDLATRLGDKLPGTTADFIEMMTMLRRQGMTSQAILGGLGESAAYLGIQLRMPVTGAAEFAAKMQDATQTAEKDMMGLMDVIQRAYYLGVDPTNMLQGFTKISAVMPILGKKGLEASSMLAPLLVMMDQTGMAGEAAGNAIRKVVQLSLDREKVGKANKLLAGQGIKLNFSTAGGKFAGMDYLFDQLQKLKAVDNDELRIAALKKLFGDDAETHQVLNTLMEKGIDGYREVVDKMQAQADLRMRVDASLKTVSAAAEAAQGSFTNMLKDMGATIAPDLVNILNALSNMASSIGAWTRENQALVKWTLRVVGGLALAVTVLGTLGLAAASVLGPMLILRLVLSRMGLGLAGMRLGSTITSAAMGGLSRVAALAARALTLLQAGAVWLLAGLRALAVFLVANPIVAALALMATAAYMVWRNWDGIKGGLLAIWQQMSAAVSAWWASTSAGTAALWQDLVALKDRFFSAGADLMSGLVNGITSRLAAVREAVVGAADAVGAWFRQKLGIASPSKVFMQYGGWISEGAALGINGGQGAVRSAALAMATAATATMPLAADAAALRIDTRAPLSAAGATAPAGGGGGNVYTITINPGPGADAQAIARAVAAELDRRERAGRSRTLSSLHDID